ncbi:MAG: ABC transporter substrate-binding protein [Hydrococcus sp. Prado102]|jgi:branched-chain amino acid transport system substrate-binding protein|nr:ABC transporter substrate-binding protein [Hydrococcus sp. Prado102]
MKKVVLRFVDYNPSTDLYSVTSELWEDNNRTIQLFGKLPSTDSILACYRNWQALYLALLQRLENRSLSEEIIEELATSSNNNQSESENEESQEIEIKPGLTNVSEQEFYDLCQALKKTINDWLNHVDFSHVVQVINANLSTQDEILVAIETDDELLWRLPWHLWRFFEIYDNAEVVLSNLQYIRPETQKKSQSYLVRILAILGDSTGIDLSQDRKLWLRLFWHWAYLRFLPQPQRQEIIEQLWQSQGWDILFFAGHSKSIANSTIGTLYINENPPNNSLTINQFANALRESVRNGLQLAIFNSCDGIGLARQLLELKVPRVIVMGEDIPNEIAQKFLKYFLQEFSSGKSLPIALRRARKKLEGIEHRFPCASWLPVLCKNSATSSLTWKKMKKSIFWIIKEPIFWMVVFAIAASAIITGIQQIQVPPLPEPKTISVCDQKLNLNFPISCGEKIILNPKDRPPQQKKVEGVNAIATGNYLLAVNLFDQAWQAEKDPETLIYLNNAKIYNAKNVYTLAAVVPFLNAPDFISLAMLQGVAQVQDRVNKNSTQWKLRIAIADDYNQFGQAQKIARELSKRTDVLGIIGHYSSHVTAHVIDIYQQNKLVLISPMATSEDLTVLNNQNNFFFRSTSTTKIGAKYLADYLVEQGYNKIVIFYTQGKAFSESFKKEFKKNIEDKIAIVGDFNLEDDVSKIRNEVAIAKKKYKDAAIALFPDAFNTAQQSNNKLAVIQENNGELLIAGSNTVYDPKVIVLGKQALQNMVVSIPWAPLDSQVQEFQKFWGSDKQPIWYYAMSFDATEMFVTVLEKFGTNSPTRTEIQEFLANSFQSEGLTGKITLKGSNRQENITALVKPICQSDISCYWQKVQ